VPLVSDLLWTEPTATPRRPLSRVRIVAAALAIADAEGLDAVSVLSSRAS